jgi:hypothetical protein
LYAVWLPLTYFDLIENKKRNENNGSENNLTDIYIQNATSSSDNNFMLGNMVENVVDNKVVVENEEFPIVEVVEDIT